MLTSPKPELELDPPASRWDELELPDAWPDRLSFWKPRDFLHFLRRVLSRKRDRIELPDGMPGLEKVPRYVLQEFHNLPNGNYSKRVTHGYGGGFDRAMLGLMGQRRQSIAASLAGCTSVLDIGCGAGHVAGVIRKTGIDDVWGLDPSPYLLQHAQRSYSDIRFVQAVAEETDFASHRFDGIAACFLFHELPPKYCDLVLEECHRIIRPGGKLVIVEPGREQWFEPLRKLVWRHGWRGLYFKLLSSFVFEPFVERFHHRDKAEWFRGHGFELSEERVDFPTHQWLAIRQ